jgi:signal-transduction protein with cAMP-binding, CBS, and nucleotidyltransferase domain
MRKAHECNCDAVTVPPNATAIEVADLLDAEAIGSVVVVDDDQVPLGIVTDRDLMIRVIVAGRNPAKTKAEEVMTSELLVGSPSDSIQELLARMEAHAVRRMPLVNEGRLVGLLSLDDLVIELSSQLYNVSESVWVALRESRRSARGRRRREAREDAVDVLRREATRMTGEARERTRDVLHDLIDRLTGHRDRG